MKEKLVSYSIAKLAEKKGFNWITTYVYLSKKNLKKQYGFFNYPKELYPNRILAPSIYDLCRWIREVHNLYITPLISPAGIYIEIYNNKGKCLGTYGDDGGFLTWENALEYGLIITLEII